MKTILQGSCSESVLKFGTKDPKVMQQILQWIADEISANTDFDQHKEQKIPLLDTAEEYDSHYGGKPSYSMKYNKQNKQILTNDEAQKKSYPKGALLYACAGLGDNEAVITVAKDGFILNIGNNDISENVTGWIEQVQSLGIKLSEAETDKELADMARDCCCGIVYFK